MWEIILEGTIPAAVFGIFATVISIILSNKITNNREKENKKYIFLYDVYKLLINELNIVNNKNEQSEEYSDVKVFFIDNLSLMYKHSEEVLKNIRSSFDNTKFVYSIDEKKILEAKITEVENIYKKLYYTKLNNQIKDKQGYQDIEINANIEMYEDNDLQKPIREFIDSVIALQKYYSEQIEDKLRKMLN